MELNEYFKSLVDQDETAIVICDTEHTIIYMNPVAIANYGNRGGAALLGQSLLVCHNPQSCEKIVEVVDWFAKDASHNRVHTFYNEKQNKDVYMIALRNASGELIGYYEKHAFRTRDDSAFYEMEA